MIAPEVVVPGVECFCHRDAKLLSWRSVSENVGIEYNHVNVVLQDAFD